MDVVEELQRLQTLTNHSEVKKILTNQINKKTTEIAAAVEIPKEEPKQNINATKPAPASAPIKPKNKWAKISQYSWDQSDTLLKFYLRGIKNVESAENVQVETGRCHLKIIVTDKSGKDFVLDLKDLFGDIKADKEPVVKVKTDYVYVSVGKDYPKNKWEALTVSDSEKKKREEETRKKTMDAMGGGDDADPQKGLMNMMKKMYEDGDDNMKRMMNKAWEEGRDKQGQAGMGMPDMGMPGLGGVPPGM